MSNSVYLVSLPETTSHNTSRIDHTSCIQNTAKKPLCIDLYAGLGGWAEGFLAEGYDVVGFDIERHDYGTGGYPAQLVLQNVLTLQGSQFRNAAMIVASPPCQAYSYRAMPWKRAKASPPPSNELFDACFRIQREACEAAGRYIPLVVENVCGAQRWVGRAKWHFGSFYLWGDVPALMPHTLQAIKVASASGRRSDVGNGVRFTSRDCGVEGRKVSMNFHEHEKTGKPGRSFQSAAVEGLKVPGNKLSENGFTIPIARAIDKSLKPGGFRLDENDKRLHLSFSRKAASAQIAKIPFALAQHIASVYKPSAA